MIFPRCNRIGDSGKELITDHVVLRRDMTSVQVQNATSGAGVGGRNTEEHSPPGPRIPFGKFLAVLELTIKNIDRTAPTTGALQVTVVIKGGNNEQFNGGKQGVCFGRGETEGSCRG
ncbi:hypothetical protein IV203_032410 [Nitzschia inconspicua]|uniref:Uncharacterized protein n=1 Tax=Nitzschia inconspicua TaxID=303405 RepID=A0A9K3PH91_9STRA|nr:hypothetical protein IV203_032410 [Nitzschia inconspicua]